MQRAVGKTLKALGAVAIVTAIVLLCIGMHPAAVTAREGELVPFFVATDASGGTFDVRSVARQNTVIVVFWDSHKPMAVRELNFLNEIYSYYQLYGLEIAAVEAKGLDTDGLAEEVEKLKTIGTETAYPTLADPGGKIRNLYRVQEVPETFILSRRGEILFHLTGFRQDDGARIDYKIKELLGLLPAPERVPERSEGANAASGTGETQRKGVTVTPEKQIYEKHLYFGNYYYNLGEREKALGFYQRCVEVFPEATEVRLIIGQIHADMKRYDKAREEWERILKYDPDNKEADAKLRQFIRGEF